MVLLEWYWSFILLVLIFIGIWLVWLFIEIINEVYKEKSNKSRHKSMKSSGRIKPQ